MSHGNEPALRPALAPLGWLYGAWMRARNAHYDRAGAAQRVEAPVVSIGNLSAGGTGKTPVVGWLARALQARGITPAIVSRGYRGAAGSGPLVVSRGAGPECEASVSGDEPWMLANTLPGTLVVVGSRRILGARKAIELGARVVLLDDGFQHRALVRDLDVVLLDATRPFQFDRLLPAGRLREPASSLGRADWILLTRAGSANGLGALRDAVRAVNQAAPILEADHRARGFLDPSGQAVEKPGRAVAFCGIGHPDRFRQDLERLDVSIESFRAFGDHERIDAGSLDELKRIASERDAALVTTEKDLARVGPASAAAAGLVALAIEPSIEGGERLVEAVAGLDGRGAS